MIDVQEETARLLKQGFTEQEIDAFWTSCSFANKVLALPDIHPMDREEYCHWIHLVQDKLLSRAAVRAVRSIDVEKST